MRVAREMTVQAVSLCLVRGPRGRLSQVGSWTGGSPEMVTTCSVLTGLLVETNEPVWEGCSRVVEDG